MELYHNIVQQQEKIAVVGLGYVGLPIAIALARKAAVIGFDVNEQKIEGYRQGIDPTGDIGQEAISQTSLVFTSDEAMLHSAKFFIVAVPTPVREDKVPDLNYVKAASIAVGRHLSKGAIVVYESTVYPGVTEEICIPILEAESRLRCGTDFKVGYSPERINPGDKEHRLENIMKIVSGMDAETLDIVAKVYELVIEAGVWRAESIKVAEAAKVIENAQRDINIAFMNELSIIFHNMGIDTRSVLQAAGTKWNFLPFKPGLVGGHCIGIDPYYLTYKAEGTGYHSKIILAGRHINDEMGKYVAQQLIKTVVKLKEDTSKVRIGILGLTYKEDCADIRNSKVIDIIQELKEYGMETLVADPYADPEHVRGEYGLSLTSLDDMRHLNVVLVAVPHQPFKQMTIADFHSFYKQGNGKVMMDLKAVYNKAEFEHNGYYYWSL